AQARLPFVPQLIAAGFRKQAISTARTTDDTPRKTTHSTSHAPNSLDPVIYKTNFPMHVTSRETLTNFRQSTDMEETAHSFDRPIRDGRRSLGGMCGLCRVRV